jgi:hypothetical protein
MRVSRFSEESSNGILNATFKLLGVSKDNFSPIYIIIHCMRKSAFSHYLHDHINRNFSKVLTLALVQLLCIRCEETILDKYLCAISSIESFRDDV